MRTLNPESSLKPIKGSKSPGTGYIFVAVIMFVAISAGTLLSGGFLPVDPNGPGGPPTLPPYHEEIVQDQQEIIFPTTEPDPRDRLQLKTFNIKSCGSTAAINFLIDTSGSMSDDNKILRLRDGLREFTKSLSPSAVIGIQSFSKDVKTLAALDYYSNNKDTVASAIERLTPNGGTRMRSGFQLSKSTLAEAITQNKFPGYKYYLILLSDGVPEIPADPGPRTCLVPPGPVPDPLWTGGTRCFAIQEDPSLPANQNIAADIKKLGVEIYAIGIFSQSAVSDTAYRPYLEDLIMNRLVSEPGQSHYYGTDLNALNLTSLLQTIVSSICNDQIGGADGTDGTSQNYPFPTFPHNRVHEPYDPPGGAFTPGGTEDVQPISAPQ